GVDRGREEDPDRETREQEERRVVDRNRLPEEREDEQVDPEQDERVHERPRDAEDGALVLRLEVAPEEVPEELAVPEEICVDGHGRGKCRPARRLPSATSLCVNKSLPAPGYPPHAHHRSRRARRAARNAAPAAAALVLSTGLSVQIVGNDVLEVVIALVWLVGMTNAFNLLDNMDGLAATLAAIGCAYFAIDAVTTHPNRMVLVLSLAVGLAC